MLRESDILFKGWLFKESRFMKKWRRRYAVITKNHFYTYADDRMTSSPTEILIFRHFDSVSSSEDKTNKYNSFMVVYQGTPFSFYCDSFEEKTKWIKLMAKRIVLADTPLLKEPVSDSSDDD